MKANPMPSRTLRKSQTGVVLVVSLMLLLVLTLLGLAATRSTTLEERMTANQRDRNVAFQAAEAALRDGESALQGASPGDFTNSKGYYDQATWTGSWTSIDWTDTSSNAPTIDYSGSLNPAPASDPRYIIVKTVQTGTATGQSLAADTPTTAPTIYQVYARGVGLSGGTVVVLESAYQR